MKEDFSFFDLDENNLDKEWLEQPRVYWEHAQQLAEARRDFEQAKATRDLVEAEVDEDIRLYPDKYKIDKVTEPRVEKAIIRSSRYQEANKGVILAKYRMDSLQAIVDALEHRKRALEGRVQLWIHDYNSEPRAPRGGSDKVKDMKIHAAFSKKKVKS